MQDIVRGGTVRDAAGGASYATSGAEGGSRDDVAVSSSGLTALQATERTIREVVADESHGAEDSTATAQQELATRSMLLAGALLETEDTWGTRRKTLLNDMDEFDGNVGALDTAFTAVDDGLRGIVDSIRDGGADR